MLSRLKNDRKPLLPLNELQLKLRDQVNAKVASGQYRFEEVDCPCCGTRDLEQIAEKDRYGLQYPVAICRSCGLVQTNPRMTQESYNEFYNVEYRRLYGGSHDPARHFHEKQYPRGKNIYRFLEANGFMPRKTEPLVVDIGCGGGGAIKYFQEKGWRVKGVDLGEEFIDYGRQQQLDVRVGTIRDLQLAEKPDLVIYSHVLEHVLDPRAEIASIKNLCSADTLVYIEVPGIKNVHFRYKRDLLLYFQNAHVYHYSLTTLNNIFSQSGFVLKKGNEYVRSLFQFSPDAGARFTNDYPAIKKYLKQLERGRVLHSYLPKPVGRLLTSLQIRLASRS